MHLSQAALADECSLFLPRLTFLASPFDGCPKICRHSSSERLIFLFRTMTNKDNLSSLFNRNFLKYVPNSIYKYLQKRKFNIMIKLEILSQYVPPCRVYDFSQLWLLLLFRTVASKQTWWPPIFVTVFESIRAQNNISWKSYKNHTGTSTPNWPKYDTFATYSQRWYWPCFALTALS